MILETAWKSSAVFSSVNFRQLEPPHNQPYTVACKNGTISYAFQVFNLKMTLLEIEIILHQDFGLTIYS